MFVNNVQTGPGNPITVSGTFFRTSIGAGHAGPDTSVDLRMWPASANATGTINVFEAAVVAEDLD